MTALVTTKVNALAAARTFGTAAGSPAHRRALVANPSEVLAEAGVVPSGTQVRLGQDESLLMTGKNSSSQSLPLLKKSLIPPNPLKTVFAGAAAALAKF